MSAVSLLARGWFKGRLGGWMATAIVLAATLTLLVLVSALFTGMQAETESRVADVFTGDLRITPQSQGVFSAGVFEDADAVASNVTGATPRMESQAILSKRSFTSILVGGDTPTVQAPGGAGDVSLGVMIGANYQDPNVATAYERHIVSGELPKSWSGGQERIPLAISVRTLAGFLSDEERDALEEWPPDVRDLDGLTFDLTAGVARGGDFRNDVYRHPARVVGLYESGVETLDSFTIWGPIEAARFLLGYGADGTEANVLIIQGDTAPAEASAEENGWATEDAGSFTQRYLGQLIEALRALSLVSAAVLFTIPAFLVAHGVERVLEAQKREVAVLRALGVPGRMIRRAMGRLVTWTVTLAILGGAAAVAAIGFVLHGILPGWRAAPVPLDVVFTWPAITAGISVALLSCLAAFWFAWRGQSKTSLPTELRAA